MIKLSSFRLETAPSLSLLVLPFQLSCIASSICRHPSYFKHSGVLRWKHERNLDDWPPTPPLSTPTILALCYLLRRRRGQRRPGCLDEVITAYQWQWGGRPSDLWGDASWVKSRGTVWDGSCQVGGFSSESWPHRWRRCPECLHDQNKRVFFCFSRILCHFQTHFVCFRCGFLPLSLSEHLNFPLTLSVMAAEKPQYMVQIRPWGMRLFLTSLSPHPPTTHIAPCICFIFCTGCDSPTFVLIIQCQWYYRKIKEWYL